MRSAWNRARADAVSKFLNPDALEKIKGYNPDVIYGRPPYAGALSTVLSMSEKIVEVSSMMGPDVDGDYITDKTVLVIHDDPSDRGYASKVIMNFKHHVKDMKDFRYATGNPLIMFTFDELQEEHEPCKRDRE